MTRGGFCACGPCLLSPHHIFMLLNACWDVHMVCNLVGGSTCMGGAPLSSLLYLLLFVLCAWGNTAQGTRAMLPYPLYACLSPPPPTKHSEYGPPDRAGVTDSFLQT
jgi:hypothetical protein